MLRPRGKTNRVLGAPLLVLGIVALFYLARGQQAARSPEALAKHFSKQGVECEVGDSWTLDELGETCWALQIENYSFTLRQPATVVAAMSEYKAAHSDTPFNLMYGKRELYRNEIYLLELVGQGDARSAEIGAIFERW